jgi:bifunctional non-homologous end joining protein LigD
VMAPIERILTHDEVHAYGRSLPERLAATAPHRYTTNAATAQRQGRGFIDYLRNGRGTTAIGHVLTAGTGGPPGCSPG